MISPEKVSPSTVDWLAVHLCGGRTQVPRTRFDLAKRRALKALCASYEDGMTGDEWLNAAKAHPFAKQTKFTTLPKGRGGGPTSWKYI